MSVLPLLLRNYWTYPPIQSLVVLGVEKISQNLHRAKIISVYISSIYFLTVIKIEFCRSTSSRGRETRCFTWNYIQYSHQNESKWLVAELMVQALEWVEDFYANFPRQQQQIFIISRGWRLNVSELNHKKQWQLKISENSLHGIMWKDSQCRTHDYRKDIWPSNRLVTF